MPLVAVAIQRRWRAHLDMLPFETRRLAVLVDRLWKGYKARREYKKLKIARFLQKNVRAFKGRRFAANFKLQVNRAENAKIVQKFCRGYLARKTYAVEKERLRLIREENIRKTKNQLAIHIQALWRAREACVYHQRLQASVDIQRYFKFYIKRRYLNRYINVVAGSAMKEEKDNFGHELVGPSYAPAQLDKTHAAFAKAKKFWWGHNKIHSLGRDENALMRQKVYALDLFRGKKIWEPARAYSGDYNDTKTNIHQDKYKQTIQFLFQSGGDSHISFSDAVIKVNRKGAAQIQVVVVTDRNIYKYTPGNYKMIKGGSPINAVKGIHLSHAPDSYIVIEMETPHRDYVLDLGTNGCERYSELATILFKARLDQGVTIPVTFGESIKFNNSRTSKEAGQVVTLKFEKNPKPPKEGGNKFVGPKNGAATVLYI